MKDKDFIEHLVDDLIFKNAFIDSIIKMEKDFSNDQELGSYLRIWIKSYLDNLK